MNVEEGNKNNWSISNIDFDEKLSSLNFEVFMEINGNPTTFEGTYTMNGPLNDTSNEITSFALKYPVKNNTEAIDTFNNVKMSIENELEEYVMDYENSISETWERMLGFLPENMSMSDLSKNMLEIPAESLPNGWVWNCFRDGSGSLKSPDGVNYFEYDLQTREFEISSLKEYMLESEYKVKQIYPEEIEDVDSMLEKERYYNSLKVDYSKIVFPDEELIGNFEDSYAALNLPENSIEVIKELEPEIKEAGFKPTASLIRHINEFNQMTGKKHTLKELAEMHRNKPEFNGDRKIKECFENIVSECAEQESARSNQNSQRQEMKMDRMPAAEFQL